MKELIVSQCQRETDSQEDRMYEYAILIDQMEVGSFACESYGVRVTCPETGETAALPHITVSVPRIDELMELLTRNNVGPDHLRDVVDDWL